MTQELDVSAFLAAQNLGSKVDAIHGIAQDITFTKIAIVVERAVIVASVGTQGRLSLRADPLRRDHRPTQSKVQVFISPNGDWIFAEQTQERVRVVWVERGEVHRNLDDAFNQGPLTGIVQNWSNWFLQTPTGLWNYCGQRRNNSVCPVSDRAFWSSQDPIPPEVSKDWVWQTQSSVLPSGNFYLWAKDKGGDLHVYRVRACENPRRGPVATKIYSWSLPEKARVVSIHPTLASAIVEEDGKFWSVRPIAGWTVIPADILPWAWRRLSPTPRCPVSPRQGHQHVFLDFQGRYIEVCLHGGILTLHHEGEDEC